MSNIVTFRDEDANAAIISGNSIGMKFNNEIKAVGNMDGTIDLINLPKEQASVDYSECSNIAFTRFVDISEVQLGANESDTVDALNAIFQFTGTGTTDLPVITSATSITITEGESINYELIATRGVGYEWNGLPAGVTNIAGNIRKLIGGTGLTAAGSPYTPTMTAINYNGFDTETLTITVSSPPYNNTRSIKFNNNDYMDASATSANPLYRPSNGSGSSDAWTIAFWFKGGTSNNQEQTILMFGGSSQGSEPRVQVYWDGNNERLFLRYGDDDDYLEVNTDDNTLEDETWKHVIITYDGGTTDNDNFNRFEIWIDGSSETLETDEGNSGTDGEIVADYFRIGRNGSSSNYLKNNCFVDEIAIWDTDETANVAAIYNSGTPHNLGSLTSSPEHYWRMGDEDTFPIIQDVGSSGTDFDFTMNNMTAADIVNDVP